ncbi:MAG: arylsulfatase [Bacteroidota bacterium]
MKHPWISLLVILSLLLTSPSCQEQQAKEASLPNIIYVLADDMGFGDLGAFNPNSAIPTPNLDRLAREGLMGVDAHSSSAVCTPTRYSTLTGRYSWRSELKQGVLTGKSKAMIPPSRTTVASMLKTRGYQTAFIGKWHLGWNWGLKDTANFGGSGWNPEDFENLDFSQPVTHTPNDLGFDEAYGISGSLDMAPYVYVRNGQITAAVDSVTVNKDKYTWWREGPTASDFVHEQVTPNFFHRSLDVISQYDATQPYFLYLALPSPHTPILPTEDWLGKSGINPYADFIMMIDHYIGKMMFLLEEKGQAENTLFIFTTDNGCSPEADFDLLASFGHDPQAGGRGHKADIYEGGHHVPYIARWPQQIAAGQVFEGLISCTDLMATCAEITGYSLSEAEAEDSYSLLPVFTNQVEAFQRKNLISHSVNGQFSYREGPWKFIACPGSGGWSFPTAKDAERLDSLPAYQLYQLAQDPGETENLFLQESSRSRHMMDSLVSQIARGRTTPGPAQKNDAGKDSWPQWEALLPY